MGIWKEAPCGTVTAGTLIGRLLSLFFFYRLRVSDSIIRMMQLVLRERRAGLLPSIRLIHNLFRLRRVNFK
jgi:hypothetical protein